MAKAAESKYLISYKNFSLDKSLEYAFDEYLVKFLKEKAVIQYNNLKRV